MKMSFGLMALITLAVMTSAKPSRPGDRIHFQDSSELNELDGDQRSGTQQRDRNHRGRAAATQQRPDNWPQFEQGIPGLYPLKGPPQAPLVLPSTNYSDTTSTLVFATQPKASNTPQQPPKNYHYAGNPFLSKYASEPPATTNKLSPSAPAYTGVTNQLPSSDKPLTTTPNPRRTNLLYGSNLALEANSSDKPVETTEVSFTERGIFDSAPHCKPNEILVGNKCRPKV